MIRKGKRKGRVKECKDQSKVKRIGKETREPKRTAKRKKKGH